MQFWEVGSGFGAALMGGLDDLVDLAVPRRCGGCDTPGVRWCGPCETTLHDVPARVRTTVAVPPPVWVLGNYSGPRRRAVIELKEHGRGDLAVPLGRALAHALLRLYRWGELGIGNHCASHRIVLVPAPTSRWAARRRGGDVVTAVCDVAAHTAQPVCMTTVAPILLSVGAADSVGLRATERVANIAGTVKVRSTIGLGASAEAGTAVVLVDDVVTTGATIAESVAALARRGIAVCAALTVAAA